MSEATTVSEREQTERLCRFMGWHHWVDPEADAPGWPAFWFDSERAPGPLLRRALQQMEERWSPLTSASDDYEVLERARFLWDGDKREPKNPNAWRRLLDNLPYPENYVPGDWSRSVLRVLEDTER